MRVSRALIDFSEPAAEAPSVTEPVSQRLKLTFSRGTSAQRAAQPQTQEVAQAVPRLGKRAAKPGKRKRGNEIEGEIIRADAGSDSDDDIVPAATHTRSGRAVKPPAAYAPVPNEEPTSKKATSTPLKPPRRRKHVYRKNDANVVCLRCQRGNSPANNAIVFCDECNAAWHQKCHSPPIEDEVVRVKEKKWSCDDCKPALQPAPQPATQPTRAQGNAPKKQQKQTKSTELPKEPPLEVGGSQFSAAERRAYLSSLSHAFLVELLVKISDNNPNVPMFPANMKEFKSSVFVYQPTTTSNTSTTTNATATNTTATNITATATTDPTTSDTSVIAKSRKRSRTASFTEQPMKSARTSSAPPHPTTTINPATSDNTSAAKTTKRSRTASTTAEPPKKRARSTSKSADPTTTATSSASSRKQRRSRAASDAPAAEPTAPGPSASNNSTPSADLQEEEFEEVEDHRLYPPAGSGFRASSDSSDLDILREDEECATFSHSLHGPAKTKTPTAVWGACNGGLVGAG